MRRLFTLVFCALSCPVGAELLYIKPATPVQLGALVDARDVQAVLSIDRQCSLPIMTADLMLHAEVGYGEEKEAQCWAPSLLGDSIIMHSLSGQTTHSQHSFVRARSTGSGQFEVLSADPFPRE